MKIIFVCTGNTCRSPMAEGYLKSKRIPNLIVESRGLYEGGDAVSENSAAAMEEIGIDIKDHISKGLSHEDLNADLFIAMTKSHLLTLKSIGIDEEKIKVLGEGISDPFMQPLSVYRNCRNEITHGIDDLLYGGFINGISVREATTDDIEKIAILEKEIFSLPWSENAIRESMEQKTVFLVAEKEDEIIGYMGLTMVLDEGYVTNVAVTKNSRKTGVGTLLMNKAIDLAFLKGLSFISLEVRASNENAISLYERLNFKSEGIRKNFYDNPKEDAIIMTRRFNF